MDIINQNKGCNAMCPVKITAEIIEGKWTTLVIRELLGGKKRFSELQKSLAGISPKVLSARLRMLEQSGLVSRTVYPTIPPSTEYELTDTGMEMKGVLTEMARFGSLLSREG